MAVGGIIVVLALLAFGLRFVLGANDTTPAMDRLNAKMTSLNAYTDEARKNARNPDIVKINSDSSVVLKSDALAIQSATELAGASGENKDVIAAEESIRNTALEDLRTAAIDGRFDRAYVTLMKDELAQTQLLLKTVTSSSNSSQLTAASRMTNEHITALLDALNKLSI